MAKAVKVEKPSKARAKKYEEKVVFNGTFQEMINISITGAGAKKVDKKESTK